MSGGREQHRPAACRHVADEGLGGAHPLGGRRRRASASRSPISARPSEIATPASSIRPVGETTTAPTAPTPSIAATVSSSSSQPAVAAATGSAIASSHRRRWRPPRRGRAARRGRRPVGPHADRGLRGGGKLGGGRPSAGEDHLGGARARKLGGAARDRVRIIVGGHREQRGNRPGRRGGAAAVAAEQVQGLRPRQAGRCARNAPRASAWLPCTRTAWRRRTPSRRDSASSSGLPERGRFGLSPRSRAAPGRSPASRRNHRACRRAARPARGAEPRSGSCTCSTSKSSGDQAGLMKLASQRLASSTVASSV